MRYTSISLVHNAIKEEVKFVNNLTSFAWVVELVYTLVLEASAERLKSSSLFPGTILKYIRLPIQ